MAEKQRELEERGVAVEKTIRREDGSGKARSQRTGLRLSRVGSNRACSCRRRTNAWEFIPSHDIYSSLLLRHSFRSVFSRLPPSLSPFLAASLPEPPQADGVEEAQLYQTWFELVLEKNRLARYESELMIL